MNKHLIIIFLVLIFISCDNDKKNSEKKGILKKEMVLNKDSLCFFYQNTEGNIEGLFETTYSNGIKKKGYFKDNKFDSVFQLYDKLEVLRMQTYYINGFENGYRTIYSNTGNLKEKYFMENGIPKIKQEFIKFTDEHQNTGYFQLDHVLEDSVWSFTGGLTLDNNLSIYDSIIPENKNDNIEKTSSFYLEGNQDSNGIFISSFGSKDKYRFNYYRSNMANKVELKIFELDSLSQNIKSVKIYEIDSSGVLYYPLNNNSKGWKYVRAELPAKNLHKLYNSLMISGN